MKIIIALVLIFSALTVQAHTLEKDGNVGAVLHIDPEDDPAVGAPSQIYFELNTADGAFDPTEYDLVFFVKLGEREWAQEVMSESVLAKPNTVSMAYIFPAKGIYQIGLRGKARAETAQDFTLTFDQRVEREVIGEKINTDPGFFATHATHILIFSIAFAIAAVMLTLTPKEKQS